MKVFGNKVELNDRSNHVQTPGQINSSGVVTSIRPKWVTYCQVARLVLVTGDAEKREGIIWCPSECFD